MAAPTTSQHTSITDFDAVRLSIASSDDILRWSHGEVTKPETINYRTQKPERDGLFCERIFGPVKDINPNDPKFRGVRNREMARDDKGDVVTKSIVRRERMAHIELAAPVSHIWFLRGTPSATGMLIDMTVKNLEKVVYFASYIIISVEEDKLEQARADLEADNNAKREAIRLRFENEAANDEISDMKNLATEQSRELDELNEEFLSKKAQLDSFVKSGLLSETDYRNLDRDYKSIVTVGMGAKAIKQLLDEINIDALVLELKEVIETSKGQKRKKLMKRLKIIEGMQNAGIKPNSMVLTMLPVIPPDLRPMVQLSGGRFATSDLNDLYRRVINRNNRLKKLMNLKAPEVICRNEMRMLQEAVDALIDNNAARGGRAVSGAGNRRKLKSLSDMLKGKQGRFRQNLLGKRVDYSGRSVIVSGPTLKLKDCGMPKMMALELFKPFVIGRLMELDLAHNIKAASRMIDSGDVAVWDALDHVIKDKYVLLNRAPTLHRLGIQAFQPKLVEGKAIQLHPLVCKGFNADFDGDQMAVHVPLSQAAQDEAKNIMAASHNLLKPADGTPVLHIEQDIVLGAFYATYGRPMYRGVKPRAFSSIEEGTFAFDAGSLQLQEPILLHVKGERRETTLGRAYFNELFPEEFAYQNDAATKKSLREIMAKIFEQFGEEITAAVADELKDFGFHYATLAGLSAGMDDFTMVEGLDEQLEKGEVRATEIAKQFGQGLLTEAERHRLTIDTWTNVDKIITAMIEEQFVDSDTSMAIAMISGARGSIGQLKTSVGWLGVAVDATGNEIELPIKGNYKNGLSPLEMFVSTRGTRKGMISTALKTADSGYLTRRLVDVAQDVFTTDEDVADPGLLVTKEESEERGVPFAGRLAGRVLADTARIDGKAVANNGTVITRDLADELVEKGLIEARIKSVLTTQSVRGIPQESYGIDLSTGVLVDAFEPIGVIAAQSIGEPGTQLTLDVFHKGGVSTDDISQGLPRVEELFEARNPKGQAFITEIDGVVSVYEQGNEYIVRIVGGEDALETFEIGKRKTVVANGAKVNKGDVIVDKDGKNPVIAAPCDGTLEIIGTSAAVVNDTSAVKQYKIPGYKKLTVVDGDIVQKGGRLTTGSINLQDLMALVGVEETQRYIMGDIQRIFASQGQIIADKHLEVVIRQMFSRVQIDEPGDGSFVIGEIASKTAAIEENHKLSKAGKDLIVYKQLLLGITKASLSTDSFLSAASFQDTTRVLIAAAVSGRKDNLYGLKENVIIGRQIPVGTGVRAGHKTLGVFDEEEDAALTGVAA